MLAVKSSNQYYRHGKLIIKRIMPSKCWLSSISMELPQNINRFEMMLHLIFHYDFPVQTNHLADCSSVMLKNTYLLFGDMNWTNYYLMIFASSL